MASVRKSGRPSRAGKAGGEAWRVPTKSGAVTVVTSRSSARVMDRAVKKYRTVLRRLATR